MRQIFTLQEYFSRDFQEAFFSFPSSYRLFLWNWNCCCECCWLVKHKFKGLCAIAKRLALVTLTTVPAVQNTMSLKISQISRHNSATYYVITHALRGRLYEIYPLAIHLWMKKSTLENSVACKVINSYSVLCFRLICSVIIGLRLRYNLTSSGHSLISRQQRWFKLRFRWYLSEEEVVSSESRTANVACFRKTFIQPSHAG